jgi:hypothetical protein
MEPRETSPKTVLIHEVRFYVPFGFFRFLFQLNMWTFHSSRSSSSSITLPTFLYVYHSFCRSVFLLSLRGFPLWLETSFAVNFFGVLYEVICVRASFCECCDSMIFGGIMCSWGSWTMVSFCETLLSGKCRWSRSGLVSLCLGMRLCCNQYYAVPGWSSSRSSPTITPPRVMDEPARCTTWKTVLKEPVSSLCSKFRIDAGEEVQQVS